MVTKHDAAPRATSAIGRLRVAPSGLAPTTQLALVSVLAALVAARISFGAAGWLWNLDIPKIHYPLAAFFHEALAEGRLPLWNDRLGMGFPLYAEGQIGAFYPPNWLIFQLEPLAAMDLSRLVHLALAGTGMGLLGLRASGSRSGSIVAALVGVLGGAIITKLEWWNLLAAYAWIPWVLLPIATTRAPAARAVVLSGTLWGVQALTGHPNTWLLTGVAALVMLVRRPLLESAIRVAWFGLLGIAVGAVQLVPTLLLQRLSVRSLGLSSDDLFTSSATPFDVIGLGFANAFIRTGSDGAWDFASTWYPDGIFAQFEAAAYVGLPVVGLAGLGLVVHRGRRWAVLAAVMAGVAVLAAFRPEWWLSVPLLNGVRSPTRAYLLVTVAIAVLAAIGTSRLGRDRLGGRPALLAMAVPIGAYLAILLLAARVPDVFDTLLRWSTTGDVDPARAQAMRHSALLTLTGAWPAAAELIAGAALGLLVLLRRRRATVLAAVAVAAVPLLVLSPVANPVRDRSAISFAATPIVERIAAEDPARVLVTNPPGWWEAMPDQLAAAGVPDVDMFSSLNLLAGDQLTAALRDEAQSAPLRRAVGIDLAITVDERCDGALVAEFEQPSASLCRVEGRLSPPYWVPATAVNSTAADGAWPPTATPDVNAVLTSAQSVAVLRDEAARLSIDVEAPSDGWVYVDRAWWPGWRASLDGAEVPVLSGLGGQLIRVGAGEHQLEVVLFPWDAGLGLAIGVVVLAASLWVLRTGRLLPEVPRAAALPLQQSRPPRPAEQDAPHSLEPVSLAGTSETVPPAAQAALPVDRTNAREARPSRWLPALAMGSCSALLYLVTDSERVTLDSFLPLADAFLHGRLYIDEPMPWLELIPRPEGGFYTPFPPVPAVVLMPFVALFGPGFDQGVVTALFGGANVPMLWLLLRRVRVPAAAAGWLTAALAVGSVHWWAAGAGSVWLHAQIVAVFFALAALHLTVRRRWPLVAGVLLGLAAASRLPMGLTLPLYLALFLRLRFPPWVRPPTRRSLVHAALFLAGLAGPALAVAAYNFARYGSPVEFGYGLIPGVLDEPWYSSGILSIEYIPRHIHLIFMRGFDLVDQFPWFRPNWAGASLVLTMPILLWLVKARSLTPLIAYGWIAVVLGMLPNLLHGAPGFAQFGYRFILDVLPIMLLMLGWVFRHGISVEARLAIVLGIAVNAYGVWAVTVADFVSF